VSEAFWLEITGEEPEYFTDYGEACAALNRWADDLQAAGWHIDRGVGFARQPVRRPCHRSERRGQ
jgi:hypothetical protein